MIHKLKSLPEFFQAVRNDDKRFEIRKNDRDFKVGDVLKLYEWSPDGGYTGKVERMTIHYITDFEQKPGFVVMS